MSTDIVGADEKKRLAQHLRNKAVGGAALSVTDLDEISQQGRGMQQQAQTMARDIGLQQARAEREMTDRARLSRAVQQSNQYKISPTERRHLREQTEDWRKENSVLKSWSPEKQTPMVGKLGAWAVRAGVPMPEAMEEANAWWSNYAEWENKARNTLFGSALTEGEQRAWDRTAINPNMQPSAVQKNIRAKQVLIKKKAAERLLHASSIGHHPGELKANLGDVLPDEAFSNPAAYAEKVALEFDAVMSSLAEDAETMSDEELLRGLSGGN
ncbi:MAG: hypothetical protein V3S01_10595 [Dehalococcoidia bacterium]